MWHNLGMRGGNQYRTRPRARLFAPVASLLSQIADRRQDRKMSAGTRLAIQIRRSDDAKPTGLEQQARHPDWDVRTAVAEHPGCPPEVLLQLARDPEPEVRCAVAGHPHCPPAALQLLAADQDDDVRWLTARHPATPPPVLERQLSDPSREVAQAAANNPKLPRAARAMWDLTQQ